MFLLFFFFFFFVFFFVLFFLLFFFFFDVTVQIPFILNIFWPGVYQFTNLEVVFSS